MTLTAKESNITEYVCLCAFLSSNKKVSKSAGRIMDLLRIGGDLPTEILSNYKEDFDVMIEDLSQVDVFQLDPKLGEMVRYNCPFYVKDGEHSDEE